MGLLGNLGAAIGGVIGGLVGGKDGAQKGADIGRKVGDSVEHFLTGGKTGTDTSHNDSNINQGGGGQQGNGSGGQIQGPSGGNDQHDDDDDSGSQKKRPKSNKKLLTPAEAAQLRAQRPGQAEWTIGDSLAQLAPGGSRGPKQPELNYPVLLDEPDEIAIPAHLYLDAKLTDLGSSMITAFIHEGLPEVGTKAEDWLKNFARYGWDPYETADAHRIYDGTMDANSPNPGRIFGPMLTFPNKRAQWNRAVAQAMAGMGTFGPKQADPGTPPPGPFPTNTTQVIMTLTPTPTPGTGSNLIDLSSLLAILDSGQYQYQPTLDNRDPNYMNGILLSDPNAAIIESKRYADIVSAYKTLSEFLDPNQFRGSNGQPVWWHEDGKVTVDEILSLIAYHEGRNSPETRQAVYARYLLYMGGDPNANPQRRDLSQGFTTSLDTNQNSSDLDRFLRFLSYYQPWREPGSDIPFNTEVLPSSVTQPNRTAAQDIQSEIQRLHSTDPTVVASIFTHNGKSILSPGITLQNDVIPQTMNLPFQFATLDKTKWPPKIQAVITEYEKGDPDSIADAKSKVYDIFRDASGNWAIVLTRQQAVDLGESADRGITIPAIEAAK